MSDNDKIKVHTQDENEDTLNELEKEDSTNGVDLSEPSDGNEISEIENAKQEALEAYDKYLRVSAEFENFKKRMARETNEFKKYANESLISQLLPVIDNLERAIASAKDVSENSESLIEGIELTLNEILKVFAKYHVEPVESVGLPFDPNFHQAMLQEETEEYPDNTIIQEMQKGYTIHNRLLRPAMVVVSKTTDK